MSLRQAINKKCRDCIYDECSGLGSWRQQVTACTVTSCPLYAVRPVSKSLKVAKTVPHEVVTVLTQANPLLTSQTPHLT